MRVLVNGCFDCFHAGHIHILKKAVKFARNGELLVLVNSDKSTRELKGEGRPIDNEIYRTAIIASLIEDRLKLSKNYLSLSYDIRVFDSEEDLWSLICQFEPDLIVKGSDRPDVREIVGHEHFPVVIVPRLPNISTTQILKERDEPQD